MESVLINKKNKEIWKYEKGSYSAENCKMIEKFLEQRLNDSARSYSWSMFVLPAMNTIIPRNHGPEGENNNNNPESDHFQQC